MRIVLGWKRIWQCGEARVLLPERSVHIVPYQVVVSVTFDQKIQDVTGHTAATPSGDAESREA
ncbi:hypothetical protein [Streptomyces sp. NPDC056982]|uniref:hypothetical protein n=1 Tax=Streptomyces sp. NPDC056982 TaxID=3345986 RepID=UPI003627D969